MTSDSPYFTTPVQNLRGKVLKGAAWMTGMHIGQKVIDLILMAVMARMLSPFEFGVVAACYVFIEFTRLFIEIGVGATIIQLPNLTRGDVRTANTIVALTAATFLGATQLAAPLIAGVFAIAEVEHALRALAFLYLAQAIGIVPENLLTRQMRARDVMAAQMAAKLIGAGGVGIACALNGFGYWSLVFGALVEAILRALIVFAIERPPITPLLRPDSAQRLLSRGVGFSASRFLNFAALQGDYVIAGRMLGAGGLGVYSRAYRLMSLPADLFGQLAERLMFPAFSTVQSEPERLRRAYLSALSLTAVIGGPMSVALYFFGADIIAAVLGAGWTSVVAPFAILSSVSYFRLAAKASAALLRSGAALKSLVAVQAIYAAGVIGLGVIAAPYGVLYLAAATSLAAVTFFFAISLAAMHFAQISVRDFLAAHAPGALTTLLFAALCAAIALPMHAQQAPPMLTLAVSGAAIALLAAVLAFMAPRLLLGDSGRRLALSLKEKLRYRHAMTNAKSARHEAS